MSIPELKHASSAFRTFSGESALASVQRELRRTGSSRVVLVHGASMGRHGRALERVLEAVGGQLAGRFDGVREHSPIPVVRAAAAYLAEVRADAVIALGGGSAIVTARAATILLAEGDDVRNLCTRRAADGRLVSPRLEKPKIPQWVIPSTPTTAYAKAGSAVRDPETGERLALFDPKTRAQGIFLDPAVALTAPPGLVTASALNAFAMAVDGLQAGSDDPLAEALLEHALRLLAQWIPAARRAPGAAEPRVRLMLASLLSGQGSDFVGSGLAQALSHALGPRSTTANGVIEAMLLPHTMRFNEPVAGAAQLHVAAAIGHLKSAGDPVKSVKAVLETAGIPARLRDVGIERADLPAAVAQALDDWAITRAPRPASSVELTEMLEQAW